MYEICASVEEVKSNNIGASHIKFDFESNSTNKAFVIKFIGNNGQTYYHTDYTTDDGDEGQLVMLYRSEKGIWASEWDSNDRAIIAPVGKAIDLVEMH